MAALVSGTRIGSYMVLSPIGAGGMGEVYRARDTSLKRDVAIKVLPAEFSRDPERLRRFRREAELLATLNHPHVAQIYGIEEMPAEDTFCLVLELVEGETVADRLARGAMPVDEALAIARQIAEALEAAHDRGIVHRDLKPANIKINPAGQVKVLDFGLAKPAGADPADVALSQSPTMATATIPGVILGTAAYMSPEQAKGRVVDGRSDIWALGCVLYEMLAGRPAFPGDTVVEILGGILKSEPDWQALPPETPPAVRSLLKRCLQKDRERRLRDVSDVRFRIDDATAGEPAAGPAAPAPARRSRERLGWIAATVALAGVAAVSLGYPPTATIDAPELRLDIVTPPGGDPASFAVSPDGRALVYQAAADGTSLLWLRPLDSETARPLAGTDGAVLPFWSADSKSIAFFAGGQLKRIDAAGGPVQSLADAPLNTRGGTWNAAGTILFTRSATEPLFRVPASGGAAVPATRIAAPHLGHRFPQFLPDGRRFLFFAFGPPESQGIYLGSLDSTNATRLLDAESAPSFSPPDFVLFARRGAVVAQRIDVETGRLVGEPRPVARQVATPQGTLASVALSASAAGPIAYRASLGERQLRWVDRSGQSLGMLGGPDPAEPDSARLSPDGRAVAVGRNVSGNTDIWLLETDRDVRQPFTSDPAREYNPVWAPDGTRIVFGSTRRGVVDLYERSVGGAVAETLVWASDESKNAHDWSADGKWILFSVQSASTGRDVWALPMVGDRTPIAVARSAGNQGEPRFSPDGRWVAYHSNESGRNEIYAQSFPGGLGRRQVSAGGGSDPMWQRGGRVLFYRDAGNRLIAMPVLPQGQTLEIGSPEALFQLAPGATYQAAPDGQRFLVNEITRPPSPITVLLNWQGR